ncbi:MAG: dethiobiotin synthase [Myxococcales bacterium FL481]|nr:MAG: dethiobiotin synthase [Myxococcales bacterium FL481]
MTPARLYIVGTDTEVGKTTVTAALARAYTRQQAVVLPFKPAQSGTTTDPTGAPSTDAEQLAAAAGLAPNHARAIAPHRYPEPFAPGLLHDATPFVDTGAIDAAPLRHAMHALEQLERALRPRITLLEGAGGWWVPMPGGGWQPDWVRAITPNVLVVARPGLGTINHTLLTLRAIAHEGLHPRGFVFSSPTPIPRLVLRQNAAVIQQASGRPYLGHLNEHQRWEDPLPVPQNEPDALTPAPAAAPPPALLDVLAAL